MALMTAQPISSVITPTFGAVNSSDTIAYTSGLLLYVKVGGTSAGITVVVPGNQVYSGAATTDLIVAPGTNYERAFFISQDAVDTSTGLVTVTYTATTGVTAALFKI